MKVIDLSWLIVECVAFVVATLIFLAADTKPGARISWWWWRYAVAEVANFAASVVYKGHVPQQTRCVASTCMFRGACNVVVV